jgi:hypothetical protein
LGCGSVFGAGPKEMGGLDIHHNLALLVCHPLTVGDGHVELHLVAAVGAWTALLVPHRSAMAPEYVRALVTRAAGRVGA